MGLLHVYTSYSPTWFVISWAFMDHGRNTQIGAILHERGQSKHSRYLRHNIIWYIIIYLPNHVRWARPVIFTLRMTKGIAHELVGLGMAMGWDGAGPKDKVFAPVSHDFFFTSSSSRPAPYDGKNFLSPSPPLGACKTQSHPVKLYFFVNFPYN